MSFSIKAFVCVSLLGAMGFLAARPGPQDGAGRPAGDAPVTGAPVADASGKQEGGAPQTVRDRYEDAFRAQADYKAILDTFYATKDGPEKEVKKAELKKKLTDIFDADMKARKAQAEEIEKRLKVLQEQYKAREAAKERIIDLQIEVLEKDVTGLGFPGGGAPGKTLIGGGSRYGIEPQLTEARSKWPVEWKGSKEVHLPLVELLKSQPANVDELKKKNHFIVSEDGKMFAHVSGNYPQGPWTITLQDSESGKVLANYGERTEVAEIRFQEGGVGVRVQGGKFEVRIPVDDEPLKQLRQSSNKASEDWPSPDISFTVNSKSGEVVDYSKLRKEYLTAKRLVDQAEKELDDKLSEARKSNPNISDDDLKAIAKSSEDYRDSIQRRLQEATMILETKIKLLQLDVLSARASFNVAEAELAKSREINESKRNAVNIIELRRLELSLERNKVDLMRAETILNLFESIKTDAEPKPEAKRR